MFEFKYDELIQFLQKRLEFLILSFTSVRVEIFQYSFIKLRVFSEEVLNWDNLLVAANLNR